MNENDCLFCKIVSREIPSKKVFENQNNYAFLDIFPINEGHTIVIPKKHFESIEDIPDNDLSELIIQVKKLGILIRKKLNFEGYNILQNNFEAAGQVIKHFHVHIIPRNKTDDKFKIKIPRKQVSEEELTNILNKIII